MILIAKQKSVGASRFAVALLLCASMVSCVTQDGGRAVLSDEAVALNVDSFEAAWETIRDKHWDPTLGGLDWDAIHDELLPRVEQARRRSGYLEAVQEMIDRFDQSHFAIIPQAVYADMGVSGDELDGDGTTGLDLRVVDGTILVTSIDDGSPAAEAGVVPGWKIVRVDGQRIKPKLRKINDTFRDKTILRLVRHRVAMEQLSGKVGATKRIEFRDERNRSVTLDITLTPEKGNLYRLGSFPAFPLWFKFEKIQGNIGYIAFNGFMDPLHVLPSFEKAVKSCMDCDGLIIDIRGNGGGMPAVAMGMAGWLIDTPQEFLGTMHMRDTTIKFVVNPRLDVFEGPVAVLIDGSSASCSEIFAGGLRDIGRARLFGTATAGAVLPAQWMELPNGDFFMYPMADYFSQNGERLEAVGVMPDELAPYDRDILLSKKDSAIEASVQWIRNEGRQSAPTE